MAEPARISFRTTLASRRAEEDACRRYLAASWLESVAGPIGWRRPSEQEFLARLRDGIVLCNSINKIRLGAVPKVVVANHSIGNASDNQPLPAYQHFENVRNFLVAVEELKLPGFEASDLGRGTLEPGSAAKIVDCVLALKSYHEWRQCSDGVGSWKHLKSPIALRSGGGNGSKDVGSGSLNPCRRLDLSTPSQKQQLMQDDNPKKEDPADLLVRLLADCMFNSKENIDQNLLDSWHRGTPDSGKVFCRILSSCPKEEQLNSMVKDLLVARNAMMNKSTSQAHKYCKLCFRIGCHHCNLLEYQENELKELKALLHKTRVGFVALQSHLQNDLKELGIWIQGISKAALGYHQAIKENRRLYNTLQELKGNIRVFCRIRPACNEEARSSIDYIGNDGSLMVLDPLRVQNARKTFQFNKVFGPTVSQDEVYKDIQCLIKSVIDGYNVCILAYGQTGSGKTYTMYGPFSGSAQYMGINYMALNDLFQMSFSREDVTYDIQVQMVEIYNEQVRDLLTDNPSMTRLEIRNCSNGGLSLPDACMYRVRSTSDVLDLMKLGEKNRMFSATMVNMKSSRSHSILTVHVHRKDISGIMIGSMLHLVDLAGSERIDKSEATGDRLKEALHINKSLSSLGDVITALAQKHAHVPYRNSKLTQLLQNSLGGHAKTLMIAHVSPEAEFYGETISTLNFAQRVSTVELGAAHMNRDSTNIYELKEQIDVLKKELACKEGEKASHVMKENASTSDRPKAVIARTPPRARRLSIGNPTALKSVIASSTIDRKVLKSPVSRPNFASEYDPISFRRLSLEGLKCEKDLNDNECSASMLANKVSEGLLHKENAHCSQLPPECRNENACSQLPSECPNEYVSVKNISRSHILPTEDSCPSFPSAFSFPCPDPPLKIESGARATHMQPEAPDLLKKLDVVAPYKTVLSNKPQTRSCNSNSRGSNIRRSIQTIGKLINGSDRRNYHSPSGTPSKIGRTCNIARKSPTPDARSMRRQSLTNIQPLGLNVSRRVSLGGLPDANDKTTSRTPPPVPSSKSRKVWL